MTDTAPSNGFFRTAFQRIVEVRQREADRVVERYARLFLEQNKRR